MLPIVLDLQGKTAVVVGAGEVGALRAAQLVAEGARVKVIAKEIRAPLPDLVEVVLARAYRRGDLAGAFFAVAATGNGAVDEAIRAEADETSTLLNVVDDPKLSTVYFPAVHRDGSVSVAVSTEGAAPALAVFLRDRLAKCLPAGLGKVAETLCEERRLLRARGASTDSIKWSARIEELLGHPR